MALYGGTAQEYMNTIVKRLVRGLMKQGVQMPVAHLREFWKLLRIQ
jgi:hypothetical protein